MRFPKNSITGSLEEHEPCSDCDSGEIESHFQCKMRWGFGFRCITPYRQPLSSGNTRTRINGGKKLEHNKAWLLSESGDEEPHSVQSSFRFSAELEKSSPVLIMNLEKGLLKETQTESLERLISPVSSFLNRFSYSEILFMTRNFSKGRILGTGAMSSVFRGRLGFMRTSLAIKRLNKNHEESCKAFCRELMIASSLHHPHIVSLVGFCIDSEEGLFLVYKYVSGGSLDQLLHGRNGSRLSWSIRYKVAVGIAEAINYLHNGTERCVVHRDIKPSNILLSSRKTPKVCDFGLASWTPAPSVPFLCKMVKGTFGYLAPEYFQRGKVSDKTDIYAFGVVLLELITGRKPIETRRGIGEENLVSWAKPFLEQGFAEKLLDPYAECSSKNSTKIARLVEAAFACINSDETMRPGAGEIFEILRGDCSRKEAQAPLSCKESVIDSQSDLMKSHFALAFEDDEHLYAR